MKNNTNIEKGLLTLSKGLLLIASELIIIILFLASCSTVNRVLDMDSGEVIHIKGDVAAIKFCTTDGKSYGYDFFQLSKSDSLISVGSKAKIIWKQ